MRSGDGDGPHSGHEQLRTSCGRDLTTGRLALGDVGYPVTRVFVDLGDDPEFADCHWASLTVAEARALAASLLAEARTIRSLSVEELSLNEERRTQFQTMKQALASITRQLESQQLRARDLGSALDRMRDVMDRNAGHIEGLKKGIEKARLSAGEPSLA